METVDYMLPTDDVANEGFVRAGFWWRVLATLIDVIIVTIVVQVVTYLLSGVFGYHEADYELSGSPTVVNILAQISGVMGKALPVMLVTQILTLLYYSTEITAGFSLGKRLLGMRIVSVFDGVNVSKQSLTTRFLVRRISELTSLLFLPIAAMFGLSISLLIAFGLISGVVALFSLVSYLLAAESRKQAIHDRIADTYVARINATT